MCSLRVWLRLLLPHLTICMVYSRSNKWIYMYIIYMSFFLSGLASSGAVTHWLDNRFIEIVHGLIFNRLRTFSSLSPSMGSGIAQLVERLNRWSQGCRFYPHWCQVWLTPWFDCRWSLTLADPKTSNVLSMTSCWSHDWKYRSLRLNTNW